MTPVQRILLEAEIKAALSRPRKTTSWFQKLFREQPRFK